MILNGGCYERFLNPQTAVEICLHMSVNMLECRLSTSKLEEFSAFIVKNCYQISELLVASNVGKEPRRHPILTKSVRKVGSKEARIRFRVKPYLFYYMKPIILILRKPSRNEN